MSLLGTPRSVLARVVGVLVLLAGLLLLAFPLETRVAAQPFSTQIQLAINYLTTGVTPFTRLRGAAGAYVNFGTASGASGYGLRENAGSVEYKSDGGSWVPLPASGTFPLNAAYWVRTANGDLTNETVMGSLGTGIVVNTTTTGVPTIYAGSSCAGANQLVSGLSAAGVATCTAVDLATMLTGVLPVANGGTGLASGTSGGVLAYTAAGTLASSGVLAANQIVLGGGAGAVPATLGSLGTATTVLHGNAAGAPTFGAVALTTDVSGILPVANGGTGTAYFTVAGPSATRTYTFPDANATILTSNAAVTAAQGGTGQTSYTVGDLLQATGATTLTPLAATSTGNALISGGVATASSWGKIGLATHTSGTLPVANGGTNLSSYTIGDLIYASGATALAKLAAVASGQVLVSAGTTTAPAWSATPGSSSPLTSITARLQTALAAATATVVQTISSVATNDDPTENVTQYRVATTDGTATALATVAITQFTTTQLHCAVTARRTGGAAGTDGDGAAYLLDVAYTNEAGTATELAAETLTVIGESQVAWTVTAAGSAGNAVISVTGALDNTVTWHGTCRSYAVGS